MFPIELTVEQTETLVDLIRECDNTFSPGGSTPAPNSTTSLHELLSPARAAQDPRTVLAGLVAVVQRTDGSHVLYGRVAINGEGVSTAADADAVEILNRIGRLVETPADLSTRTALAPATGTSESRQETSMSTERKEYNGWTTYETWAVGMFLDGNYTGDGTYREVQDITNRASRHLDETPAAEDVEAARDELAEKLEGYVREALSDPKPGRSLDADLMVRALGEVNWHELADGQLDGVGVNVPRELAVPLGANTGESPTTLANRALAGVYDGPGVVAEVQQRVRHAAAQDSEYPNVRAADALKEYVDGELRQEFSGLGADLVGATLSDVDWRDLAEHRLPERPSSTSSDAPECRPNLDTGTGQDNSLER